MSDWRSYDEIAERYDQLWSPRFEAVARHIWNMMPPRASDSVLDIGTGTGAVPITLPNAPQKPAFVVGCDLSMGMLVRARARVVGLRVLAAHASALPFASESFNVATANFVLSHVRDYSRTLAEVHRVLKPCGRFAASTWAPPSDPYSEAWSEGLAAAISKKNAQRAIDEVAPSENYFSQEGHLESAVALASFAVIQAQSVELEFALTVEEYLGSRELSSGGRLGRHLLGSEGWAGFLAATSDLFQRRFGTHVAYIRRVFIVIATKP